MDYLGYSKQRHRLDLYVTFVYCHSYYCCYRSSNCSIYSPLVSCSSPCDPPGLNDASGCLARWALQVHQVLIPIFICMHHFMHFFDPPDMVMEFELYFGLLPMSHK